jgi:hypothetical protein
MADAKIAELKAAEAEGVLVPAVVHEEVLGRVLDRVRSRIRGIPGSWADRLDPENPRRAITVLRAMVDDVLSELSGDADRIVANPRHQEIPGDFPEVGILRKAGVELFAELLDTEDLTEIHGVGPAKAARIDAALQDMGLTRQEAP